MQQHEREVKLLLSPFPETWLHGHEAHGPHHPTADQSVCPLGVFECSYFYKEQMAVASTNGGWRAGAQSCASTLNDSGL